MQDELIQQARELCEKATPGPWEWICDDPAFLTLGKSGAEQEYHVLSAWKCESCQKTGLNCLWPEKYDAAFIARSRTLIPELCDALDKAEEQIESIHRSLDFAETQRQRSKSYTELAINNGLALGRIAVTIQHDFAPLPAPPEEGEGK
jgi:hypothetical protein